MRATQIYYLEIKHKERMFYKIGVTEDSRGLHGGRFLNTPSHQFKVIHAYVTPRAYEIEGLIKDTHKSERAFQNSLRSTEFFGHNSFGYTETFYRDVLEGKDPSAVLKQMEDYLKDEAATREKEAEKSVSRFKSFFGGVTLSTIIIGLICLA